MVCNWAKKPGSVFVSGNPLGTDPVQGNAADNCSFIAALGSLIWVKPDKVIQAGKTGTGIYKTDFYSGVGTPPIWVDVTDKICLDPAGNFQYARSSKTGTIEIWPSMFEKAYARFLLGPASAGNDTFAMDSVAWPGNSKNDLVRLTGKNCTTFEINPPTGAKTYDQIYQDIKVNRCSTDKTKYPMVAWTYNGTPPSGYAYDAQIWKNHAYSILGVVSSKNYFILRNPKGVSVPTPGIVPGNIWKGIDLASGKGVFALDAKTFKDAFAFHAWCQYM